MGASAWCQEVTKVISLAQRASRLLKEWGHGSDDCHKKPVRQSYLPRHSPTGRGLGLQLTNGVCYFTDILLVIWHSWDVTGKIGARDLAEDILDFLLNQKRSGVLKNGVFSRRPTCLIVLIQYRENDGES